MLVCSPWTRGGYVDSNVYDHTSVLRFLTAWTGVKPANVTPWRASVTGDLTTAFDFRHPDFSIPRNIPTLAQTWALTQLTGGSTAPPAEGAQKMPVQERGSRPHRPTNYRLHADVTVDRAASKVTAALTNTGRVGASLAVYPDALLPFAPTPFTVLPSAPGSYVWDATATAGKYAFSVYGPDGFLTSFAGQVVPAGQDSGQVPVVTATPRSGRVELTLANQGQQEVTYTLTPNDFKGHPQTVTVKGGKSKTVGWRPTRTATTTWSSRPRPPAASAAATRAASPDRPHRRGAWVSRGPRRHRPPGYAGHNGDQLSVVLIGSSRSQRDHESGS